MDRYSSSLSTVTDLAQYLIKKFENYQNNRQAATDKWNNNNDLYHGIDIGGWTDNEGVGWRSKSFINITRQKVMGIIAGIMDIYLAGGEFPFILKPDMEMEEGEEDEQINLLVDGKAEDIGFELERTKAETEFQNFLHNLALYGEGWTKKIIKDVEMEETREAGDGGISAEGLPLSAMRFERVKYSQPMPAFISLSPYSIYRDMETRDTHEMEMIIQQGWISPYELRKKAGLPGYIESGILQAIHDSPPLGGSAADQVGDTDTEPRLRDFNKRYRTIRHLECWGRVPVSKAMEFEKELKLPDGGWLGDLISGEDDEKSGDEVYLLVELAGKEIVRYQQIKKDDIPYEACYCEDDPDLPYGWGIADNVQQLQTLINGLVRLVEDNARMTGKSVFFGKLEHFRGMKPDLTPGAFNQVTEDVEKASDAIYQAQFADVNGPLLNLLTVVEQFIDEESGLPKLSQGMPDPRFNSSTATEINERSVRSMKRMGLIIRNLDRLMESNLNWMVQYNENNLANGGGSGIPVRVQALGFNSFINRTERSTRIQQMIMAAVANPVLLPYAKIGEMLGEWARCMSVDPDQFWKSETEVQQERVAQQMQQLRNMQQLGGLPQAPPAGQTQPMEQAQTPGQPQEGVPGYGV